MRALSVGSGAARVGCALYLVPLLCCSSLESCVCQVQRESRVLRTMSGAALGELTPQAEGRPVEFLPVGKDRLGFPAVAAGTGHTDTGTVSLCSMLASGNPGWPLGPALWRLLSSPSP